MEIVGGIAQVAAALWILNVWILRFNKETEYRAGDSKNMVEEFTAYGFPAKAVYLVGAVKITLSLLLLAGFWVEGVTQPAAAGLALIMLGAIGMHVRVGDRPKKAMPAISVLVLSTIALIFS
jgi:uncharacterized membrane protein YphA (DoxX/SURF4 family)